MQLSESKTFDDEVEDKIVVQDVQECRTLARKRAWKPKVENLNMKIINDNNFV